MLAAVARERPSPVYFIGFSEQLDELEPFILDRSVEWILRTSALLQWRNSLVLPFRGDGLI